jgi:hypothetical protein
MESNFPRTLFLGLIVLYFSLTRCSTTKEISKNDLIGVYCWDGALDEIGATINLKADSTFLYEWQRGLDFGQTKGVWRTTGKQLILNSEFQPNQASPPDHIAILPPLFK